MRARLNRSALERSFCEVPSKPIEHNEREREKRSDGRDEKKKREGRENRQERERGMRETEGRGRKKRALSSDNKYLEGFSSS